MGRLMWCSQLVCLQLVLLHSLSSANLCSHDESSALLRFKQLFSFSNSSSIDCNGWQPDYPKMKYWKEDTDCCSWEGVSCDRVTGHVISLNLSCSWLQGNIPSNTSLFLLSHLQKLNLAYNDFNLSQIPSDFVRFPCLTHLNLSDSSFSGQVPLEISHLSKLISLDLSSNDLTLETLVMKGLVQNMSQLQELSLDSVNMSTVALGTLTNINLPTLIYLGLGYCELQGPIPSRLFSLPSLETIDLFGNQLSGPIPSSIFELLNLTRLYLFLNHLSGTVELSMFAKLKNLEVLDLSYNSLSMSTTIKVNSSFPKLNSLALSSCDINEFPEILSTADNLQHLDLSDNKIHGHIPNWLFNISTLSSIYLSHNFLTGIEQLPWKGLQSLELDLSLNQLSGPIPSSIFELVNLVRLYLFSNHLSGTVELSMFAKLKNLEVLDLSYNSLSMSTTIKVNSSFPKLNSLGLSSCNINEFPEILSTVDNLHTLDLSNNTIHGHIPNWLFNISNLSSLYLSHNFLTGIEQLPWKGLQSLDLDLSFNQLSGPIPSSIFELVNLTFVDLSSNHLSGMVELSMFAKLKNLELLDLSYNSLSMSTTIKANSSFPKLINLILSSCIINEFPEILSTADNLQYLDLSNNQIHGHIPNWLFNISTLSSLDLSHNFLTGIEKLPWKGLQYLDLLPAPPPFLSSFLVSHNNMTGAIPSSLCNSSSIRYLDLSNNCLSGSVPQCLVNSTTISVLDLRMNYFHGNIPQTFANGSWLTTLNLNGNQLEGSLPPSLVNCVNLEVLDLGNNMINDTFPHWLETLPELQVLILRFNRFYGPLGNSRTRIPFSKLRILDLSHNGFNGPLRTRFFKNLEAMMSGKHNSAEMTYMRHGGSYYDSVIVTMKGVDIEMLRILTIFTAIDLSSNKFQGQIPDVVGKLNSLKVLNFSHNILIGHIPLSLENLTELESLDLSSNRLGGEIPTQLTSLTSLSVLNLSYNQLAGPIPKGKQFNTFENNSYFGNLGLCGEPLLEKCGNAEPPESEPIFHEEQDNSSWFDWKIIMMGYGSGLVIGLSMGYIVFSTGKPWWFVSLVERKVIKLSRRHRKRRN